MVSADSFKKTHEGNEVSLHELRNNNGTVVLVTNFGARIVQWLYKGVDIVVGFDSIDEYFTSSEYYYGATIGRFANRIRQGQFSVNGRDYSLDINNPPNHLHGGHKGFHNKSWNIEKAGSGSMELSYFSKDGEEGYPGNLSVLLTYTLNDEDELEISYRAETDATTIINLTNHSFFNLNGQGNSDILDHTLQINSDHFTPIDENLIPLGALIKVDDTPFDFRIAKKIGEDINKEDEQLKFGCGYDHNFVLGIHPEIFAARVVGDQTGIILEVYTNQPGMQFYSGNFMKGQNTIKGGKKDEYRTSFCLETQHFPDSPNQPGFPSAVLNPGEAFTSKTVYKLSRLNIV